MTSIDAQLAREFFELIGFRVHTSWAQHQRSDGAVQLYVENPRATEITVPEFVLAVDHFNGVRRAVVEVRPWHTERLYASVIENSPVLTQFAAHENIVHAADFFGNAPFKTILIVSELPPNIEQRVRSIRALESEPIDHVLEFPTILHHLIGAVNINSSYSSSATLQLIQLLKRYRLIQYQQMEFQFQMDAPPPASPPKVETTTIAADEGDKYEDDEWE